MRAQGLDHQFIRSLKARREDVARLLGQLDDLISQAETLSTPPEAEPDQLDRPAEGGDVVNPYKGRSKPAVQARRSLIEGFLQEGQHSLRDMHERVASYGISRRQVEHSLHSLRDEGKAVLIKSRTPRDSRWAVSADAPHLPGRHYLIPF